MDNTRFLELLEPLGTFKCGNGPPRNRGMAPRCLPPLHSCAFVLKKYKREDHRLNRKLDSGLIQAGVGRPRKSTGQ